MFGLKIVIRQNETQHIGSWIFGGPLWWQWLASKLRIRAWAFVPMYGDPDPTGAYRMGNTLFVTREQYAELQRQFPEARSPRNQLLGMFP